MGPIFIELTFTTEKTFIINVESIDCVKRRRDENGNGYSELTMRPAVKVVQMKETADEIMKKIKEAKMGAVNDICNRLRALGCFR